MTTNTAIATKVITKPGRFVTRQYNVIIHNDDTTTFDFVMDILQRIFDHDAMSAAKTTRKIHVEGKAIVATYPKEIADDKVSEAATQALASGFSLQIEAVESDE